MPGNVDIRLCRFVCCKSSSSGGGLFCYSFNLLIDSCEFLDCMSSLDAGGMKVENGKLDMKCVTFKWCHGEGRDNSKSGTAFGTLNTNVNCSDLWFHQCWNTTYPFKDNVYGMDGGRVKVTRINSSHCQSQLGGLSGHFASVYAGSEVSYINTAFGTEYCAHDVLYSPLAISYINIIKNSFTNGIFYSERATMTISHANIFGNKHTNDYGASYIHVYDSFSDTYSKATLTISTVTIQMKLIQNCLKSMTLTSPNKWKLLNHGILQISLIAILL